VGQLDGNLHRKRVFDVVIGLPLAILATPMIAALALGSLIEYRSWPLFAHARLGRQGKPFRILKIRSLPTHVPTYLDKHDLRQVEHDAWGDLLRRHHLDELPQLWLVAVGTMSLVGPRPEMPTLSATFDPEFVAERLTMPPGCTGLWQISEAAAGLIGDAEQWDLYYVRHRTLLLDWWVVWRTARQLAGARPISTLASIPSWTKSRSRSTSARTNAQVSGQG
jgi:lipopolysaccharide/colanic/teichoic acid biosynthesis glycosyltransferase